MLNEGWDFFPTQPFTGFKPVQAEDKVVAVACGLNHDGLEQPVSLDGPGELVDGGFVEVPQSEAAGFNPVLLTWGVVKSRFGRW